jgi:hypothetical protein
MVGVIFDGTSQTLEVVDALSDSTCRGPTKLLARDWTADDTVLWKSTVSKVSILVFTIEHAYLVFSRAGGQVDRSIGVESGQGVTGMKDLNLLDNFLDGTIESKTVS